MEKSHAGRVFDCVEDMIIGCVKGVAFQIQKIGFKGIPPPAVFISAVDRPLLLVEVVVHPAPDYRTFGAALDPERTRRHEAAQLAGEREARVEEHHLAKLNVSHGKPSAGERGDGVGGSELPGAGTTRPGATDELALM